MASEPRPEISTLMSMCASFRCVCISFVLPVQMQIPKVSLGAGQTCGVYWHLLLCLPIKKRSRLSYNRISCMYVCMCVCVCMYVGFKTFFCVVRHLDSIASCLPTGLHLGFFRSWPSLFLPSNFSSVFFVLSFVLASTSMQFWALFLLPFFEHGHTMWAGSVQSFIIVSSSPICCLIVTFLILSFLDILEDLLRASISVVSTRLLLFSVSLHVSEPYNKLLLINAV